MTVVTLIDYTPVPRTDDVPWTVARIEEAAAPTGTWTLIDSFTLDPVDADPASPQARSFTTAEATIDDGWYRIVWADADSNESATPAVQYIPSLGIAYKPTVADVAAVMPMRTFHDATPQMTFNTVTSPTGDQVRGLIDAACAELEGTFGQNVATPLVATARRVVTFRTAMLIEASYFASQIRTGEGPYAAMKGLYTQALKDFVSRRLDLGSDGEPGTVDDQSGSGLAVWLPGTSLGARCEW